MPSLFMGGGGDAGGDEVSVKSAPKRLGSKSSGNKSSGNKSSGSKKPSPRARASSPFFGISMPSLDKSLAKGGGGAKAAEPKGHRRNFSSGSLPLPALMTPRSSKTNNNRDEATSEAPPPDIERFAVQHDELVTALIDEALRNAAGGDANDQGDDQEAEAIEVPAETAEDGAPPGGKKKPPSPYRMTRNLSRQLGNSPVVSKLRKRPRPGGASLRSSKTEAGDPSGESLPAPPDVNANATNPAEFFHRDCVLQKEKSERQRPSLGFGMASSTRNGGGGTDPSLAATGREDTLAKLQQKLSMLGEIESGKYGKAAEMLRSDAVAFALPGGALARPRVETRSILTLRMGFVSLSYGILLQWDCAARLVERIVLRKMCREDFLKRKEKGAPSLAEASASHRRGSSMSDKPPLIPKKPALIPVPASRREMGGGIASNQNGPHGSDAHNRLGLPKFHLPHNPFSGVPRLFTGALHSQSSGQSFLSVSVLSVKKLHGGCDHCRNPTTFGGIWSSMMGKSRPRSASNGGNSPRLQRVGERKLRHTVRPYVRFVLGNHEHRTKITKFNDGSPSWGKRHHNSCMLPCPPEELRWFAGREDLIVEVRNNWKSAHHNSVMFGGKHGDAEDPILAVVTVPLSSVNIDDEEEGGQEKVGDGRTFRRRTTRDGASSTTITIPLRMSCCDRAPTGSISLRITRKAPSPERVGVDGSSPASSLAKPNIHVDISVSNGGDRNGEPKVSESIELGLWTRLNDWALGDNARDPVSASKESREGKPQTAPSETPQDATATTIRGKIKQQRIRWSKRFDPQTKRWSALRPSANGGVPVMTLSPSSSQTKAEDEEAEDSADNRNEGWFAFLNSR